MVISRYNYWSILVHIQKITLVVLKTETELKCWLPKKTPNLQFESVYLYRYDGSQNKLILEKGHHLYLSALLCFVASAFFILFSFFVPRGRRQIDSESEHCVL